MLRKRNIEDHEKGLIISLSLKTLILSLSSIVYLTEKTRLSKLPQVRVAMFLHVQDVFFRASPGFTDDLAAIMRATLKGQFIQSTSNFTFIFCSIYFLDFLLIQGLYQIRRQFGRIRLTYSHKRKPLPEIQYRSLVQIWSRYAENLVRRTFSFHLISPFT